MTTEELRNLLPPGWTISTGERGDVRDDMRLAADDKTRLRFHYGKAGATFLSDQGVLTTTSTDEALSYVVRLRVQDWGGHHWNGVAWVLSEPLL